MGAAARLSECRITGHRRTSGSAWHGSLVQSELRGAGQAAPAPGPDRLRADVRDHQAHHPDDPGREGAVPQHHARRRPHPPRGARCSAEHRRRIRSGGERAARGHGRDLRGRLRCRRGSRARRVRPDPLPGRRVLDRGGAPERGGRRAHGGPGAAGARRILPAGRERPERRSGAGPARGRAHRRHQLLLRAHHPVQGQGADGGGRHTGPVRGAGRGGTAGPADLAVGAAVLPQPAPGPLPRGAAGLPPRRPLGRPAPQVSGPDRRGPGPGPLPPSKP